MVRHINITETELEAAGRYLQKQFDSHSRWPKEQPGEARREFGLMKGSATSLNVWCERWLDAGQLWSLEKALNR